MEFEITLMGLAVYLLIWDKLPNWGSWFKTILNALPAPLQTLYSQWNCAYCSGFWIALVLHQVTGLWTLPALAEPPSYMGAIGLPINLFLDALASGTMIYVANRALLALGLPLLQAKVIREGLEKPATLKRVA